MIYVVIGPTASGKSDVAHYLSEIFKCGIINADAFQIYKDMNIGTNKVSSSDPIYEKYHLIDILSPNETYSVKQYQDDARKVLFELLKENKDVVIVGGTGLYIKALLYDYSFNEENDASIDEDLLNLTNDELHYILEELDKEEAKKIHPNNRKRVFRAIMLIRHSNVSKTALLAKQEHKLIFDNNEVTFIYINPDRNELYNRINQRVDEMIDNGLIEEVKSLKEKYDLSFTSFQGIGYKEVIEYLDNEITLEECIELIKKRTRNYAKRQVTFFSHQFGDIKSYQNSQLAKENFKK